MNQDNYTPAAAQPEKPKRNTLVIVLIVVLALCCLCAVAAGLAWQFGDSILKALGLS
jgi:flagellar basal body-associated protein FliL